MKACQNHFLGVEAFCFSIRKSTSNEVKATFMEGLSKSCDMAHRLSRYATPPNGGLKPRQDQWVMWEKFHSPTDAV
jgi:hypothetical protein